MTAQSEADCLNVVEVSTFRALACQLHHRFRSDRHQCPIIGIDGPPGSGKTLFAEFLAREIDCAVINADDLVPGWSGLRASIDLLEEWILAPVSQGQVASWQRFDWHQMRPAEWIDVAPASVLIVEGCGVGHVKLSGYLSYLVWMNAPERLRIERLQGRADWTSYEPFSDSWSEQERALRAHDDVATRADLIVESAALVERIDPKNEFAYRLADD